MKEFCFSNFVAVELFKNSNMTKELWLHALVKEAVAAFMFVFIQVFVLNLRVTVLEQQAE